MPVSDPSVVDAISTSSETGAVELHMFEARAWEDVEQLARDLESKVNAYLDFVLGGQLQEFEQYRSLPVVFHIHWHYHPPAPIVQVTEALTRHLEELGIGLAASIDPRFESGVDG